MMRDIAEEKMNQSSSEKQVQRSVERLKENRDEIVKLSPLIEKTKPKKAD